MQPGARRRARNNGNIVSNSICETRMKMTDQVKGGIKVLNCENRVKEDEKGVRVSQKLRRNQSDSNVDKKKRRNWKPPEPNGVNCKNSIQLRKAKSDLSNSPKICDGKIDDEEEEEDDDDDEIEIEGDMKDFDDKEIDLPLEKQNSIVEEKKINDSNNEIPAVPEIEKNDNAVEIEDKDDEPDPIEIEEDVIEPESETQNRMQIIVDMIMWRNVSKSAFIFGFGSFFLLSSSYTKDIDFSILSAVSYLGLVYLALIFIYRSILRRGEVEYYDEMDDKTILSEEDAIWIAKIILPYINEVLIKLKALFSGGPETTMKLAVLLFVMARCGNSITVWTLSKLVFFGVFTIPKVFSSYSVQLARYGKFWIERFRDGWESCTQKKAVAAGIFILIWNISSTVARVWAVFMLIVAVKLYKQQYPMEWNEEEVTGGEIVEEEVSNKAEEIIPCDRSGAIIAKRRNMVVVKDKKWT